jgi:pimeloyl-ACP methyl ester carboxylesterase
VYKALIRQLRSPVSLSGDPARNPTISMKINLNGRSIYYELHGPSTGPVVILLHHGLGMMGSWEEQIPVLSQAGFRVLAYDRWGYGKSQGRPWLSLPYFEEDRQDLLSLMQALEVPKASVIGHSDGGTIALYFARQHPHRVKRMVIVAAHIYIEPSMIPGIQELRRAYEHEPKFQEGMRRAHGEKAEQVFQNWYGGWVKETNLGWDMRPLLGDIHCPVLVVQGLEDEHATPQHAHNLASSIAGAELWLVPEAGHMFPRDLPEVFNPRLLEFLEPELIGEAYN